MVTVKLNLQAIAGADHMTSPEADKHDFDRWYRNTIHELLGYAAAVHSVISVRDREIEVLTQERDNALLRIEELEQALEGARGNWRTDRNPYRGGVNPNA